MSRFARARTRTTAVSLLLLLVAACGSGPGAGDVEGVATYPASGAGGMDALLSGTVAFEDECLYLRSQDFDERWLPVFPAGQVDRDGQTLNALGSTYDDGDLIELPGGAVREPTSPHPVPDEYEIPASCSTDYLWLVAPG